MIPIPVVRIPASPNMTDVLACERALVIDVEHGQSFHRKVSRLATTMRTVGHDQELAMGLLFSLGIIDDQKDVLEIVPCLRSKLEPTDVDHVAVHLNYDRYYLPSSYAFGHARYSSCGICGSYQLPTIDSFVGNSDVKIDVETLLAMPEKMAARQAIFKATGGSHGVAWFDIHGSVMAIFEDVGRHNALDKLVGHFLMRGMLPHEGVLAITSRASFEIVQKAIRANVKIVAVMGAVSSLSVELADGHGVTLIGFLRSDRFNIYTHPFRVLTPS